MQGKIEKEKIECYAMYMKIKDKGVMIKGKRKERSKSGNVGYVTETLSYGEAMVRYWFI